MLGKQSLHNRPWKTIKPIGKHIPQKLDAIVYNRMYPVTVSVVYQASCSVQEALDDYFIGAKNAWEIFT